MYNIDGSKYLVLRQIVIDLYGIAFAITVLRIGIFFTNDKK